MEIKAMVNPETKDVITVTKNLGANLAEKTQLFGEEVVNNNADDSMVITIQSAVRRLAKAGKTPAEIQAHVDAMNFTGGGARGPRKDPMEAFLAKFETMDPEKQKEMLQQLKAKLAARG